MKRIERKLLLVGILVVSALAFAGCFGGGDDDEDTATTTTTTVATPVTPTVAVPAVPETPVAPPTPTAAPPPQTTAAPPTPTVATTAAPAGAQTYTVVSGDTFAAIANRFNVSLSDLEAANSNIADINVLSVGQVLNIPGGGTGGTTAGTGTANAGTPTGAGLTYTIASGDTLASIADRFNTTVDSIVAANGIENADVISVGDVLTIPTG